MREYSSNLSKAAVNRAIDWLHSAGIIGFAGKLTGCDILSYKAKSRAFFMDLGLTTYFLTQTGCRAGDIQGVVNENFVYLDLKRRISYPREIALETPAFSTWGKYEIDFFVKSVHAGQHTYAVEVKAGKTVERPRRRSWRREKQIMFCMQREIRMVESMEILTRSRFMG